MPSRRTPPYEWPLDLPTRHFRAMTRIIGSVLVRNEDIFVERALLNIVDFCDEILVQDHQSTDRTPQILESLAARFPKIKVEKISDPKESSRAIAHFAGTPAWIFGVDGDEIYDPEGLRRLRTELLAGQYDDWWVIFGNVLHCSAVDVAAKRATGYLTPPSKSMTKLYQYRLLKSVDPDALLRLAGRHDVFHDPAMIQRRLNLHEQHPWEEAWFRCLHTCFMPRSSLDCSIRDCARECQRDLQLDQAMEESRRAAFSVSIRSSPISWKNTAAARPSRSTSAAFFAPPPKEGAP